ncbi:MAG: hypothetical protein QF645_08695 [Planctomycetota bacterium]|jgi:hypothetical protein|nr:hypothetical protein [Planctomycetota bacterium]
MKITAATIVFLVGIASVAMAQRKQPTQEELISKLAAKKEEAFLRNAAWRYDFDKAKEIAQKEDKRIFAYFTRSYAP